MQHALERTTSWNSTKDDDFGVEWDGDLMRVDLEHSLMETAALQAALEQQPFDTPVMHPHAAGAVPMPPSPQPKHRGGHSAAAVAAAMGSLQPLGAEDSSFSHSRSHSQSSHFPPPLARTAGGGNSNSSNHRVRKFVIGGMSQPCPATPVPAVTPLGGGAAIPSFSSSSLSSSTHEADKENDRRSSCTSTAAVPSSSSSSSSGEALPSSAAPADLDVVGQKRKRSERVSVRLVPLDAATAERVRRAGYNPKLELWTPLSKKVGFFLGHLAAKWARVPGINSLQLRLAVAQHRQEDELLNASLQLRALSAHFRTPKPRQQQPQQQQPQQQQPPSSSSACMLQLAYVLRAEAAEATQATTPAVASTWLPEENSLFDAFAFSGILEHSLTQPTASAMATHSLLEAPLPSAELLTAAATAVASTTASAPAAASASAPVVAAAQQPPPRVQHTTGFGASFAGSSTDGVTVHVPRRKKRTAPTPASSSSTTTAASCEPPQQQPQLGRMSSSSSSSSLDGCSSSGGGRDKGVPVAAASSCGSDKKRRRIRPTPVSAGEAAASTSPSFFQATVSYASSSNSGSNSDNSR